MLFVIWFAVSVLLLMFVGGGFSSLVRQMQAGFELDDLFMVSLFELAFGAGLWMFTGLSRAVVVWGADVMSLVVVGLGGVVVYSYCSSFLGRMRRVCEDGKSGGEGEEVVL